MSSCRVAFAAATALMLAAAPVGARADEPAKKAIDFSAPLKVPITGEVRDACESGNATDQAYCYGMIQEAYDANFYIADAMAINPLCIPKATTAGDLRKTFLDGAHADADQTRGPFAVFFYLQVGLKYKCDSQGNAIEPGAAAPGAPAPATNTTGAPGPGNTTK